MKRLSPYLKPENDRISITVNWFEKAVFIHLLPQYSCSYMAFMLDTLLTLQVTAFRH